MASCRLHISPFDSGTRVQSQWSYVCINGKNADTTDDFGTGESRLDRTDMEDVNCLEDERIRLDILGSLS